MFRFESSCPISNLFSPFSSSHSKMASKVDEKLAKPLPAWCQFSAGAIAGVSELLLLYPLGEFLINSKKCRDEQSCSHSLVSQSYNYKFAGKVGKVLRNLPRLALIPFKRLARKKERESKSGWGNRESRSDVQQLCLSLSFQSS